MLPSQGTVKASLVFPFKLITLFIIETVLAVPNPRLLASPTRA